MAMPTRPTWPDDCATLAGLAALAGAPVSHEVLRGVGYAWDVEPIGGTRLAMLPAPGVAGRVGAMHDAALTAYVADRVTRFFRARLGERGS